MSNGKLLRQLIRTGAEGDLDAFRGVARKVIAEERLKQHHLLADDLESILCRRPRAPCSPALRRLAETVPEDRERGMPLLSLREPARGLEDIVLSRENLALVEGLLREHNRADVLKAHGLRPADRVLLCGPPGCGKTLTAEVIASELGWPLATVRTDGMVSSFLGETAANLRKLFDFAHASPTVMLFDEFDALGSSVLGMLDPYAGRSLIVAAANHETMLDAAVWRPFEEVLFLKKPTAAELRRLIAVKRAAFAANSISRRSRSGTGSRAPLTPTWSASSGARSRRWSSRAKRSVCASTISKPHTGARPRGGAIGSPVTNLLPGHNEFVRRYG